MPNANAHVTKAETNTIHDPALPMPEPVRRFACHPAGSHQAVTILRALGGIDRVGMDVVEVAPAYDQAEITALAGATLAHDWLSLVAQRRRDHA